MEEVTQDDFVRLGGRGSAGPLVSRAGLRLHTYGVVASIEAGHAGFVPDEYLAALRVDTGLPALELTLLGVWTREDGGYRVAPAETLRVARAIRRQLTELEAARPCPRRFGG